VSGLSLVFARGMSAIDECIQSRNFKECICRFSGMELEVSELQCMCKHAFDIVTG
jgi:hypothetical protein